MNHSNHPQDIARREGDRTGMLRGACVTALVTLILCIMAHAALMDSAKRSHERTVAMLQAENKRDADAYLKGATATAYTAGWAAAEESRLKEGP